MSSRALAVLEEETCLRHVEADGTRLSLTSTPLTLDGYRAFLERVYGFEGPVETAFQMTPGLAEVTDVRGRIHTRLLKSDLVALGHEDVTAIPCCAAVPAFADALEALGWMYVIERGRMLSSALRHHVEERLHRVPVAYLSAERSARSQLRELGATLDSLVRSAVHLDRVVVAAHGAFRCQTRWYLEHLVGRRQVA